MRLKQQVFDFRLPIADLRVCDAFNKKRPTPIEFQKSAIKNRQCFANSRRFHDYGIQNG